MKKKIIKQYKLNQFKIIQQKYKYIYILRYSDFTVSETIQLKKKLKPLHCHFLCIKKKLIQNQILYLNGQGSVFLLYSNQYDPFVLTQLFKTQKFDFLFVMCDNLYYSHLKMKQITYLPFFLNSSLIKPFSVLLHYLKKANIT